MTCRAKNSSPATVILTLTGNSKARAIVVADIKMSRSPSCDNESETVQIIGEFPNHQQPLKGFPVQSNRAVLAGVRLL